MTKLYNKHKSTIYYYTILLRDMKHYRLLRTDVDVIGETEKSYCIILHQPIINHKVGDKLFVSKRKIKLQQYETETWNDYWYNK